MAQLDSPKLTQFIFHDKRLAWLWLLVRVYIGWQWLFAGYEKLINSNWIGEHTGTAITGFLMGALQKTTGPHPDVSMWYAWFITHIALPQAALFSYLVVFGELLVGLALILGVFVGFSAFMGAFMNMNYLLAGTVSSNPIMLLLQILLILARRTAGYLGADYYLRPFIQKYKSQKS